MLGRLYIDTDKPACFINRRSTDKDAKRRISIVKKTASLAAVDGVEKTFAWYDV